jgi:hypothetical protein
MFDDRNHGVTASEGEQPDLQKGQKQFNIQSDGLFSHDDASSLGGQLPAVHDVHFIGELCRFILVGYRFRNGQ